MDLALNNHKGWYAIKPKQPTNILLRVNKTVHMLNWIV